MYDDIDRGSYEAFSKSSVEQSVTLTLRQHRREISTSKYRYQWRWGVRFVAFEATDLASSEKFKSSGVEDPASSDKFIVFIEVADLAKSEMFKSSGVEDLASSDKFIVCIEIADLASSEKFKSSGVEDLA